MMISSAPLPSSNSNNNILLTNSNTKILDSNLNKLREKISISEKIIGEYLELITEYEEKKGSKGLEYIGYKIIRSLFENLLQKITTEKAIENKILNLYYPKETIKYTNSLISHSNSLFESANIIIKPEEEFFRKLLSLELLTEIPKNSYEKLPGELPKDLREELQKALKNQSTIESFWGKTDSADTAKEKVNFKNNLSNFFALISFKLLIKIGTLFNQANFLFSEFKHHYLLILETFKKILNKEIIDLINQHKSFYTRPSEPFEMHQFPHLKLKTA